MSEHTWLEKRQEDGFMTKAGKWNSKLHPHLTQHVCDPFRGLDDCWHPAAVTMDGEGGAYLYVSATMETYGPWDTHEEAQAYFNNHYKDQ